MPITRLDRIGTFVERVRALGDRLGPIRVTIQQPRDEGLLAFLLGSLDPGLPVAFDFRDPSWEDAAVPLRVNALEAEGRFRYLRYRDPPFDDAFFTTEGNRLRPLLDAGVDVYAYFRHEDAPVAPAAAERLRATLSELR
jgi:hypothetical protein